MPGILPGHMMTLVRQAYWTDGEATMSFLLAEARSHAACIRASTIMASLLLRVAQPSVSFTCRRTAHRTFSSAMAQRRIGRRLSNISCDSGLMDHSEPRPLVCLPAATIISPTNTIAVSAIFKRSSVLLYMNSPKSFRLHRSCSKQVRCSSHTNTVFQSPNKTPNMASPAS
jgi:hypothetical protein